MRRVLSGFALIGLCLTLAACGKPDANTLVIGTVSGPETELVEVARDVLKTTHGLTVKIVEFNDYNLPNEALLDKSLDANVFQHLPYYQQAVLAHGYPFEVIGKTFIYPTGIYSKKYNTLEAVTEKAIVAIPNDPSNESRALHLLEQAGLITLKSTASSTLADVAENPKHLHIKEMDAAQLPRVLNDVDLAVINTNFALPAGLNPMKDALYHENKDSPYANLIVIRQDTPKREQLQWFVEAMHSKNVRQKAKQLFGHAAIPAW